MFKISIRRSFIFIAAAALIAGCQRSVNWYFNATGTLKDGESVCYTNIIKGTYYNRIQPGSDTAYVELTVNVFTTGSYNITTDLQNGLRFFDSGFFNKTGVQIIHLKPEGAAKDIKATDFTVRFDTSICSFTVDVKDSALLTTEVANFWRYTDVNTNVIYSGKFNATHYLLTNDSSLLSLRRESVVAGDTTFEIGLVYPSANITTGTFTTQTKNNVALSTKGRCINCAWDVMYVLSGALTTITVDSYDPATNLIHGTFEGTTVNWDNKLAPVKKGEFSVVIDK